MERRRRVSSFCGENCPWRKRNAVQEPAALQLALHLIIVRIVLKAFRVPAAEQRAEGAGSGGESLRHMRGDIKLHQQFAVFRPRKLHGVLKRHVFTYAHREAIRTQRKNIPVQRAHCPVQRALIAGCGERIGIYGNAHCAPVQPIAHGGGGAVYI